MRTNWAKPTVNIGGRGQLPHQALIAWNTCIYAFILYQIIAQTARFEIALLFSSPLEQHESFLTRVIRVLLYLLIYSLT